MISVKSAMPLWKWILLIVFGSALFLFLSQTVPVVGSFSNNIWIKALLLLLGATAVLGLYAVWVKVFERRKVSELNLRRALPDMLTGLLIGSLFIASVVGVLAVMGVYRINSVNVNWIGLLLSFAAYSIVAVTEEVLFRGILFRMIDERYGALLAFIISSLTFGAVHLMTVDFWTAMAISAEAGFMLAAAYRFRNNLWIPIGIHWAWNFTLGPVFGVGVSGISEDAYAIIPEISGPYILTGGNNGFEGSIVTLILGIATGVLLLWWRYRKQRFYVEPIEILQTSIFRGRWCLRELIILDHNGRCFLKTIFVFLLFWLGGVGAKFENIARLAIERATNSIERRKAYRTHLARFEFRKIYDRNINAF